jgi:hypothetical protein
MRRAALDKQGKAAKKTARTAKVVSQEVEVVPDTPETQADGADVTVRQSSRVRRPPQKP